MELLLLVFFCLLTGSEVTFGAETTVTVKEGSDVTLPCSLNTTDITKKKFVWKKDGRQVFRYDAGYHSNNVNTGQDQLFIRRVEHFQDELKSGDASITISNMRVADNGLYTCEFPDLQPRQIFYVKLVVYAAAKPCVTILKQTKFRAQLQCEVQGAFPKPEVHWQDGAGNKCEAEKLQEIVKGGHYDVILQTTVLKADRYRCVATQKEINYHADAETYVSVPWYTAGDKAAIGLGIILVVSFVGGVFVLIRKYRNTRLVWNGPTALNRPR